MFAGESHQIEIQHLHSHFTPSSSLRFPFIFRKSYLKLHLTCMFSHRYSTNTVSSAITSDRHSTRAFPLKTVSLTSVVADQFRRIIQVRNHVHTPSTSQLQLSRFPTRPLQFSRLLMLPRQLVCRVLCHRVSCKKSLPRMNAASRKCRR